MLVPGHPANDVVAHREEHGARERERRAERLEVMRTDSVGAQYIEFLDDARPTVAATYTQLSGNMTPSSYGADGNADALQRFSDREPHAPGGEPGVGGARDACG